jgi:hypothetical protein
MRAVHGQFHVARPYVAPVDRFLRGLREGAGLGLVLYVRDLLLDRADLGQKPLDHRSKVSHIGHAAVMA